MVKIICGKLKYEDLSTTDKLAYRWLPCKYFKKFKYEEERLNLVTENEKIMLIQILLVEVQKRAFIRDINKIRETQTPYFVEIDVVYSTTWIVHAFYTGKKMNNGLFFDTSHVLP
jgi:hypothetical protein